MADKLSFEDMKAAIIKIASDWYDYECKVSHLEIYNRMRVGKRNRNLKCEDDVKHGEMYAACPIAEYLERYATSNGRFDCMPGFALYEAMVVRDFISDITVRFARRWLSRLQLVKFDGDVHKNSVFMSDFMFALGRSMHDRRRTEFMKKYRPELICMQVTASRVTNRPVRVYRGAVTVDSSYWSPVPVTAMVSMLSAIEAMFLDIDGRRYAHNSPIPETVRLARIAAIDEGASLFDAARISPDTIHCNNFTLGGLVKMKPELGEGPFGPLNLENAMKDYIKNSLAAISIAHNTIGATPWSNTAAEFTRLWEFYQSERFNNNRYLRNAFFSTGQMVVLVHDLKMSVDNFHHLYGGR